MTGSAVVFLILSWSFVLGLTAWSFARILRHRGHHDPDGIGPTAPPDPPLKDRP